MLQAELATQRRTGVLCRTASNYVEYSAANSADALSARNGSQIAPKRGFFIGEPAKDQSPTRRLPSRTIQMAKQYPECRCQESDAKVGGHRRRRGIDV